MSESPIQLRDKGGRRTFQGTQSPAGGGGSQPYVQTFTAAEIAARWDNGAGESTIELTGIAAGDMLIAAFGSENTLDQVGAFGGLAFYTPGASTADVNASAETGEANLEVGPIIDGTYVTIGLASAYGVNLVLPGAATYAIFTGDNAPTAGAVTVHILRAV